MEGPGREGSPLATSESTVAIDTARAERQRTFLTDSGLFPVASEYGAQRAAQARRCRTNDIHECPVLCKCMLAPAREHWEPLSGGRAENDPQS